MADPLELAALSELHYHNPESPVQSVRMLAGLEMYLKPAQRLLDVDSTIETEKIASDV